MMDKLWRRKRSKIWTEEAALHLLDQIEKNCPRIIAMAKEHIVMPQYAGLTLHDAVASICLASGEVDLCEKCGGFHKRNAPKDH